MATNKSKHLSEVLTSHKMGKVQEKMDKYIQKKNEVKDALDTKYSDKLATSPIDSGSLAKYTAINKKFDIDLCAPFMRGSFNTLKDMADELFRYFDEEYQDDQLLKPVKKQRVSIGLEFNIDGEVIGMDVIPGREINTDEYTQTFDLKLYVRPRDLSPESETKTNIKKHIDLISGKTSEREIIRLLKVWKHYNDKKIKSFKIELLTLRAFEENAINISDDLWGRLEMTMTFIRDNIETIQLKDPANSNNIVSNTMTASEKNVIANDMKTMLENIESDSDFIKTYFKINPDFPPPNNDNKYGRKEDGASVLTTQNFGYDMGR